MSDFSEGHDLGKLQGKREERERIIKLLETLRCPANKIEHDCDDNLGGYNVNELIALIKGENK